MDTDITIYTSGTVATNCGTLLKGGHVLGTRYTRVMVVLGIRFDNGFTGLLAILHELGVLI